MKRALQLAKRGRTSPNPMVGAVIVKKGEIIGEGYHPRAGEPHAEVFALRAAGEDAKGAALYVTLEPCCHYGRTPPCSKAVIKAGISEVYVAMADPDKRVATKGIQELKKAGIAVHCPLLEDEARLLNEAYIKHRQTGMPLVTLKSAMSLDGRIATRTNDSKWITNEKSRAYAHKARSRMDAIIVGGNTARKDNPSLTARLGKKIYYPKRVIVSSSGNLPDNLNIFALQGETYVAVSEKANIDSIRKLERAGARIISLKAKENGCLSMADLMKNLADIGCLSVLIEGGGGVAASALEEHMVDKILYFYAPKIIGGCDAVPSVGGMGAETVASSVKLEKIKVKRFGDDIAVEGYVV